jgi:hypothetical protein
MNYRQRFHTVRIAILGMIVAWGGIMGLTGVAHGQVSYEELYAFV